MEVSGVRTRRGSLGLDGAESSFCDLSGRGLAAAQIERTLRVFETAEVIDLSNNEIERIPATIPHSILALDVSFNVLASAEGIERLKGLQEVHLGFNRLADASLLEFCPRLQRVNLSGNRLMNTRGLETLVYLEHLDLSDNLIEFPDALRPLSLNQNLTHLALKGNPIRLNPKNDYRVLLLDMIPSVLVLDDKKIRGAVKCRARLYDDKKQFVIHNQNRPHTATRVKPLLAGDATSKYDGTMFLQPAQTQLRAPSSGLRGRSGQPIDEKQRNVLSVIQSLIHHKKQTLATLSRTPPVATT
ncbi:hypothetical protein PybrP1_003628 [[Pythium] brassicae (nom. inval.)]|nr:hypothetical protein PybrP1_003628 [[Pythium] brassicae (nom. inval.)]